MKGIAALEAHSESQWEKSTLREFITEISQLWLHRMSTAEKQSLLELLADAQSPGARWTKAYTLYKLKNRFQAVIMLMPLISEHPDSVGAEFAIRGLLVAQWSTLRDAGATAAVDAVIKAAPNNPGTAWALCRITWRFGAFQKFPLAHTTLTDVITTHPDTLASVVATQLNFLLNAIESTDYTLALRYVTELRNYLLQATPPSGILRTLCYKIDWDQPQASSVRIDGLKAALARLAEFGSDTTIRGFAYAGLGYIAERMKNKEEALKHYQSLADLDDFHLDYYGWQKIAYLTDNSDPKRAIAALEKYRELEAPAGITTGEHPYMLLARLYVRQKRYAEGEEIHRWLLAQRAAGEFLRETQRDAEQLTAGLAGCLFGLGRDQEAHTLADPLLAKYRYGTPKSQLTRKQRSQLATVLYHMGRKPEADKLRQGW